MQRNTGTISFIAIVLLTLALFTIKAHWREPSRGMVKPTTGSPIAQVEADPLEDNQLMLEPADSVEPQSMIEMSVPSGQTSLTVTVKTLSGLPLTKGTLTCWASASLTPELDLTAHGQEQVIAPGQERYTFALPATECGISLLAEVNELPPTRLTVPRLRTTEVVVVCGVEPQGPVLEGQVTVDGTPRIPRGLRIELIQDPPRELAGTDAFYLSGKRTAIVWRADASYVVYPLMESAILYATSEETAPKCMPVARALNPGRTRQDLALSTGNSFSFLLVDSATGSPIPHFPIVATTLIYREKKSGRSFYQPHIANGVTGADGKCILRALPPTGTLSIAAENLEGELFKIRLADVDWSRIYEVELTRIAQRGEVWGPFEPAPVVAKGCEHLSTTEQEPALLDAICYRRTREEGAKKRQQQVSNNRWEVLANEGEYYFWGERDGVRITPDRLVTVLGEGRVGPVLLDFEQKRGFDIRIRGLSSGLDAHLDIQGRDGTSLMRASWVTSGRDISCSHRIPEDASKISIALLEGKTAVAAETTPGKAGLDVAWPASLSILFEPEMNGKVRLYRINGAETGANALLRVQCSGECVQGMLNIRQGLPSGSYFYRIDGIPGSAICGVVDIGASPQVLVKWTGTARQFGSRKYNAIQVVAIHGVDIRDSVPDRLRQFDLVPGAEQVILDQEAHVELH